MFAALAAGETHLLLADGAYFSLRKPELEALQRLIDEARELHDQQPDGLRISRYQVGWWTSCAKIGVVQHQAKEWTEHIDALRAVDTIGTAKVPAALTAQLRPYQHDGFQWLRFLWQHGLGGVLADDMGLGKTLQCLALVCDARERDPKLAPFLVVAPTSVVPGWVAEARRFAPDLSVVAVTDTLQRSGRTADDVIEGAHVVVLSYTLLRLDFEAYRQVEWAGLFLDEAQHAKNHRSKIYGCLRQLPAPSKIAITGTPMENNLMELWSLLSITAPGSSPTPHASPTPTPSRSSATVMPSFSLASAIASSHSCGGAPRSSSRPNSRPSKNSCSRCSYRRSIASSTTPISSDERQKVLGLLDDDFARNRFTTQAPSPCYASSACIPALIESGDVTTCPASKIDTLVEQLARG